MKAEVKVKQHVRHTKTGKTEVVKQHERNVNKKDISNDEVLTRKRLLKKENKVVTKTGKVIKNPLTKEMIEQRYKENYPVTWGIMTKGKWDKIDVKGKKQLSLQLDNENWKKLLAEHQPLLYKIVKSYNYGSVGNERFRDLKLIADFGFVEGVNAYGKYFDPKDPQDFSRVVMSYVQGRLKEYLANKLRAGLKIPVGLQKPYRQFLKVKENFNNRNIVPTDEQLAKQLNKIWNKKTFYPQYELAEDRKYKDKRNGLMKLTFKDLSPAQQKDEKKKDILPMNGFINISKDDIAKDKDETHIKNMKNIEEKYKEKLSLLNESYEMQKTMSDKDRKIGQDFIEKHKNNLKNLNEQKGILNKQVYDEYNKLDELTEKSKENFLNAKTKKEKDKFNKIIKLIDNDEYRAKKVAPINLQVRENEAKINEAEKQLKIVEEFYKPLTTEEYQRRKQFLDITKNNLLDEETKRYNNDKDSSKIMGIMERIKQFNEIETIKEIPLNLQIDNDDEGSQQIYEVLVNPDEMTHDKKMELLETHRVAKEALRQNIDTLMPIYKEVFSLYSGLNEDSPKTADNLWGELFTNDEIKKHLDKKYKTILDNPERFLKLLKKTEPEKRVNFTGSVPYIAQRYRNNPNQLIDNYDKWLNNEPKTATKKEKINIKVHKELVKKWKENRKKAKQIYDNFKSKNKNLSMAEKAEKYKQIKNRLKANPNDYPSKFKDVKVGKKELQTLKDQWKETMPLVFSDSDAHKNRYINGVIDDSAEIMRRLTPIKVVRDLLSAHRKLVENGISLEKAFQSLI